MFSTPPVLSQVVDDVSVKETKRGYDLIIKFFIPLRYQGHSPQQKAKVFEVQVEPQNIADPELMDRLGDRSGVSWDIESPVPLQEVVFDGQMQGQASIILRFAKPVEFSIKNSPDLRSLIVSIKTDKPVSVPVPKPTVAPLVESQNLIAALKQSDPKMAQLLERANQDMLNNNYTRAVQLFTKIRDQGSGEVRVLVQELLGLAREYNGQMAHAKAEYKKYLEVYPEGVGAQRVTQRLNALVTAAQAPKEKLKSAKRSRSSGSDSWDTQLYGGFAQFYYRDETTPEDDDSQVIRSDLTNDMDAVVRLRKGDLDLKAQFIASYREDLRSDSDGGEFLPSILSFEARDSGSGLYGRIGRQSRTTGGVLGRFDGFHGAYEINPTFTLNTVAGYPVDTTDRTAINTDQEFYGASMDVSNVWDGWDFSAFYITQDNAGITDREAVGGEVRYFDSKKSFFTLVDYDTFYEDLNIFLLVGNWSITDLTTLNLVLDYRNSPILTTTNAIQGQAVDNLSQLLTVFSEQDLYQLAQDRTAKSQSVTAGITQQITDDWQLVGEVTSTELDGTVASGGVLATPPTGPDYFYSTQLIANNFIFDTDTMILGLRYSDTLNANTYSVTANWRVNVNRKLRFNPRMRADYREDQDDGDSRTLIRPFIRMDYRLRKWVRLEFDLGYERLEEQIATQSQTTTGYFFSAGYRLQY